MKSYEITNLKIEEKNSNIYLKYENINFTLQEKEIIGVYSKNPKITERFLKFLAGINKQNNIMYCRRNVFDNKEYFKERVYMDFSNSILSTLSTKKTEQTAKLKYDIDINVERLASSIKEFQVRSECEIGVRYTFTKEGITLANFVFLDSMNKKTIIINNPTINIIKKRSLDNYIAKITDKSRYEFIILGLDKISVFKGKLDKLILFDDLNKTFLLDASLCTFVIIDTTDKLSQLEFKNLAVLISTDEKRMIVLNKFSKEDFKQMDKLKLKYIIVSLYEIENYL